MTDELIKKTYRDVEIVYVERDDKWNSTVNGRERNADSLAQAKESIDRSLDYERKERPWKPFAGELDKEIDRLEDERRKLVEEMERVKAPEAAESTAR